MVAFKTMQIRRATHEDVVDIWRIAHELARKPSEEGARGFLVPYRRDEYADFVRSAEWFYVLCIEGCIEGFLFAHSQRWADEFAEEPYAYMQAKYPDADLIVCQIGLRPTWAGRGLGLALYDHLWREASSLRPDLRAAYCFIRHQPLNQSSRDFHAHLGWRELEVYTLRETTGAVSIWRCEPQGWPSSQRAPMAQALVA